jgi:hypothetical protein
MADRNFDVTVDFSARGNSSRFCISGWSVPEPDERWSLGFESRMVLPAPREAADVVMVLKLRSFVSAGRLEAQRLKVTVNWGIVGDFVIRERTARVCRIPWQVITGHDWLDVRFQTPDAARPAALEGNLDERMLAIAFASLVVYPDPHGSSAQQGSAGRPSRSALRPMADIVAQLSRRDLMLNFESLGQNCEFGLVQRRCEAEPLGLLRFASAPLPHLLNALDDRFAGVGHPDEIRVEVSATGKEYMVADKRYGLLYHAWVKIDEMIPEEVHRREARRLPLLTRKLLDDLQTGDKIFVFKGMGSVAEEEVLPLVEAIRRYGPNTLLLATLSDRTHRSGVVEWRMPGLMIGYIDRFAPEEDAYDLLLEPWIGICREAYRLRLESGNVETAK